MVVGARFMKAILTDFLKIVAFFPYKYVFTTENGTFFMKEGPSSRNDDCLGR